MRDSKKSYYLILLMPILYALLAYGMANIVQNSGICPSGMDTLSHLYKGDVLYHAIREGNFWPLSDPFWYNGVEFMRYLAPVPVYLLAACEFFGGGSPIGGYLIFVMFICFLGAVSWLYVGFKVKRPYFGAFLGALWFFMPNNLTGLFYEGNLPHSVCIAVLPLLLYWVYDYLQWRHWYTLPKLSLMFAFISLCHVQYGGILLVSFLIYFVIDGVIRHDWHRGVEIFVSFVLGVLLTGAWLIPSRTGSAVSESSLEIMEDFFQSMFLSINPAARFQRGCVDAYFGLAVLLLAVFGGFLSKKKSMPGFWTGIIILICTSETLYLLFVRVPGGQVLLMLRLVSMALCMVLFSFLIWDTLKKGWIVLFAGLLILDALPSLPLILGSQNGLLPEIILSNQSDMTLVGEAKEMTEQRLALVDESGLGAMSAYLVTGYGEPVAGMYGAAEESAATLTNIKQIDRSLEEGNYLYLFDRCLEMGNDTVIIQLDIIGDTSKAPLQKMDRAAERVGYRMVAHNDSYRLYKLNAEGNWGTVTKYRAIGIGSAAPSIVRQFPVMEESERINLNEFTFEELKNYELIYLAGFTYNDKASAEKLITDLSEAGVHIVIAADGIPDDRGSQNQSFLGVICNGVSFSQGYPDLDTIDGVLETDLFPNGYREWSTVYLDGLTDVWGTVKDVEWELPFYGTAKNDNIVMIGLNLTYYYGLTEDESVGKLLSRAMDLSSDELPEREIVPYTIQYESDRMTIVSDRDDVNTGLAYHDSFTASQDIYSENHLTYVKSGTTVISLEYPYLNQGIAVTILAALFLLVYTVHKRRLQTGSPEKEVE